MTSFFFHNLNLRWLALAALTGSLFLTACNNDPKATDPDKTATVVEAEHEEVAPVTPGDSAATGEAGANEARDDD
jgi:hypothetical protein